jgi:hypothetical protein
LPPNAQLIEKAKEKQFSDSTTTPKEVVPNAYKPNFKFKALGKEMEIDKFLHDAIKDAESEKKIRELYEKAHGLDYIKPMRDRLQEENQALVQEKQGMDYQLKALSHFVQTDNMGAFFQALKIPEDKVLKYALE